MNDTTWDCIVVGAGAAGLSAALVLGRARQRTLVVDAGHPSNLPAEGVGGLLGHDGRPPAELYAIGRDELAKYPSVEVRSGAVVGGKREDGTFVLELDGGTTERARRVLLATGMDYRAPDIPGVAERWGRSVFHCPFCHGWEVQDQRLGVLDGAPTGVLRALLLRQWSDEVTLFTNGPADHAPEDAERLRNAGVAVEERPIAELRGPGSELDTIVLADGTELPYQGLLVAVTLHQRDPLAELLDAAPGEATPLVVDPVQTDPMHHTTAPGVFAAGDVSGQMQSVANAIAAGSITAAMVVHDLVAEAHGLPSH